MVSDPSPEPRTVQELYYEALSVSANNPENNITPYGAHPSSEWIITPTDDGYLPSSVPPAYPEQPPHRPAPHEPVSRSVVRPVAAEFGTSARVSDIFQETDVRQAIQSLASQAGVKVVMDDAVGGFTSAIIEDEPFDAALEQVLLPLGLISKWDGGQYLVGPDDPESSMFARIAETAEYKPLHRPPQELQELLAPRTQRYVRIVDHSNMMVIEAPPEALIAILDRLKQFDQPVPQVVLEAIVCVLTPQEGVQHGFDFGQALSVGDQNVLGLGLSSLSFTGAFTPWGVRNWYNDFAVTSLFVRMLADEGYLSIRAAPRVMAKDGEQAVISIGRETYFSTQPLASDLIFRTDIQKVEAGIELDITPTIRGDNITVTIEKAEVSEDIRNELFDRQTDPYPLINRRRVSTTVDVKDGETIVIGGLQTRQTVDRVGRVPYLGDIPLVGKLFRIVESEEQDVEVVIFISPRLVPSGGTVSTQPYCPPVPAGPGLDPVPAPPDDYFGPQLFPAPPSAPPASDPFTTTPRQLEPVRFDSVGRRETTTKLPPPRIVSR